MFADVRTTGVEYPSVFLQMVNFMSSWANLDFWSLFSFSCLINYTFLQYCALKILLPTFLTVVCLGVPSYLVRKGRFPSLESLGLQASVH